MRTVRNWWRNFRHAMGDCAGAWSINVQERSATCHFCGFVDYFGKPRTDAEMEAAGLGAFIRKHSKRESTQKASER